MIKYMKTNYSVTIIAVAFIAAFVATVIREIM